MRPIDPTGIDFRFEPHVPAGEAAAIADEGAIDSTHAAEVAGVGLRQRRNAFLGVIAVEVGVKTAVSGMSAHIEPLHRRLQRDWRRRRAEPPADAKPELALLVGEAFRGTAVVVDVVHLVGVVIGVGVLHAQEQAVAGRQIGTDAQARAVLPIILRATRDGLIVDRVIGIEAGPHPPEAQIQE